MGAEGKGKKNGLSIMGEIKHTKGRGGGMGFRDLKAFNLALLAKQGWRILKNPSSLVHRVYKAKYFAKDSFLHAQLGRRPSYAWQSIMAAKEVIVKGYRWNIGNGQRVNIWDDQWIPRPESFKVVSPRQPQHEAVLVSDLIDVDRRSWNIAKVRSTFLPHDAEAMLGIPLSFRLPKDSIIWAWTTHGKFTVKSANVVAQKWLKERNTRPDVGSSSDSSKMRSIWKLIW